MKALIFGIMLVLFGCKEKVNEKPWVIYQKGFLLGHVDKCSYRYYSANGGNELFFDKCDKYHVGDTIR